MIRRLTLTIKLMRDPGLRYTLARAWRAAGMYA